MAAHHRATTARDTIRERPPRRSAARVSSNRSKLLAMPTTTPSGRPKHSATAAAGTRLRRACCPSDPYADINAKLSPDSHEPGPTTENLANSTN